MASETVDPIDWPLLTTIHRIVPPEFHALHCENVAHKSQDLLQPLGRERATIGTQANALPVRPLSVWEAQDHLHTSIFCSPAFRLHDQHPYSHRVFIHCSSSYSMLIFIPNSIHFLILFKHSNSSTFTFFKHFSSSAAPSPLGAVGRALPSWCSGQSAEIRTLESQTCSYNRNYALVTRRRVDKGWCEIHALCHKLGA